MCFKEPRLIWHVTPHKKFMRRRSHEASTRLELLLQGPPVFLNWKNHLWRSKGRKWRIVGRASSEEKFPPLHTGDSEEHMRACAVHRKWKSLSGDKTHFSRGKFIIQTFKSLTKSVFPVGGGTTSLFKPVSSAVKSQESGLMAQS